MRSASFSLLTILCLLLAVAPAVADTLYSNGPINGTTDAWPINSGSAVSDSFDDFCINSCKDVGDLHIGVWLFPGDNLGSVQMDLGSTPFGTDYFSGVLNASGHTDLGINQYGYDIQQIDFSFSTIQGVCCGFRWVTLSNAVETVNGDPIYWDENSGIGCQSEFCPSTAFENSVGSIPSEAFTLTGTSQSGTTPEPSSILLFGSGILGLVGIVRRRLSI